MNLPQPGTYPARSAAPMPPGRDDCSRECRLGATDVNGRTRTGFRGSMPQVEQYRRPWPATDHRAFGRTVGFQHRTAYPRSSAAARPSPCRPPAAVHPFRQPPRSVRGIARTAPPPAAAVLPGHQPGAGRTTGHLGHVLQIIPPRAGVRVRVDRLGLQVVGFRPGCVDLAGPRAWTIGRQSRRPETGDRRRAPWARGRWGR